MKSFSTFAAGIILLFSLACASSSQEEINEYSGTIESVGMTSYQYGTHTLEVGEAFYALKSDTVDLGNFVGKTVTIKATKVPGYPIDGGPIYLNVISIKD
ncbi:hypothetical protein [Christiangramia salexigens]|uniref:DUF5666 domain-containing protein n=1 Tax=Christiangramia salexigens TaxID=1913577 RepID=A0A1L3J6B0_9FLAO|nr:hypothetical protein [Christiangramia salexigens]APG60679.1 hypothetical protein LPB144_09815 [Christiangramia salexigens]